MTDNRTFWRAFVPIFSNENSKSDKIILNEDGKSVRDKKELCRTFSTCFTSILSDLKIPNFTKMCLILGVTATLC